LYLEPPSPDWITVHPSRVPVTDPKNAVEGVAPVPAVMLSPKNTAVVIRR
jgi:hypothetical protein